MNSRSKQWCILLCVLISYHVEARRLFLRGRQRGGMLGSPRTKLNVTVPDEYFEQQLDHFNPIESRTWKQVMAGSSEGVVDSNVNGGFFNGCDGCILNTFEKLRLVFDKRYFTNASFHVPGGPVFLMIGGEATAEPHWMVEGQWINYAQKFHALCFQLEHRYYGLSQPTTTISTRHLMHLNSEQALADLANFIEDMTIKHELPSNTKWIAFGGSYSGSLAAWMRAKYPHLVHGAVSASAPLLAKADFREYYRVVKDDLSVYNKSCVAVLHEANRELHTLLKTPRGQETVNDIFKLCSPIDVLEKNDVSGLYDSLAANLAAIAQYNGDNREETNEDLNLNVICEVMVNESIGTPVHRYAAASNLILESEDSDCLDYKYDNMINELEDVSWGDGSRQWFYQTCTEFGFYQTSSLTIDLFGDEFPLGYYVQQCSDVFGPRFNKEQLMRGIRRTNVMYGALTQPATRIVYVHGSLDPWHPLGITKTIHKESPAIYIKGTAHCADMYPPSPSDPPQLDIARKMIGDLIGLWLDEY